MIQRFLIAFAFSLTLPALSLAQKGEVTFSLSESFLDSLIDAYYQNFEAPEFQLGATASNGCSESVKILRERGRTKTAIRFKNGTVTMPLAFSGRYDPPLIGCLDFAGTADAVIDLQFDRDNQRLIGKVRATSVNLSGTGGIGSGLIARLVQGSIDKSLNPLEIVKLDKLGFTVPILDKGNLRMEATAVRTEVTPSALNIAVVYQFSKP